jgi:16S rRNA (guanine(527)-N(7))-methyltransferase RsmG
MSLYEALKAYFPQYGFSLSEEQMGYFQEYARLLLEWNEKINLTAITQPEEIAIKHFLDSALLLKALELPENARVIDVGTGAGFPSLPCALLRRDFRITLLDSLQKRIVFLQELSRVLDVSAECLHGRAEEVGRKAEYREKYDLATARAVAKLGELAEYCLPFVRVGGVFAALKGYDVEEELDAARAGIQKLGGKIEKVEKFDLPDGSRRSIICIRKISQTSTKYPRNGGKIKKNPL